MTTRTTFVALAMLLGLATALLAERPNLGKRMLDAEATHVLVGDVKAVYSRDVTWGQPGRETVERHYLIELEVDAVEKGEGFAKKDLAYVRCWQRTKSPPKPTPGPGGHGPIPKAGWRVRAHVAKGEYGPTRQTDNGIAAVYPNGFEVLGASPRTPPRRRPVPADEQAPPKGRVISIAGDGKTVIISLGSEQGVRPGSRYTVARGPSYVGTVEVTAVRATQSTARVLEHLQKSPIRPGDVVIR